MTERRQDDAIQKAAAIQYKRRCLDMLGDALLSIGTAIRGGGGHRLAMTLNGVIGVLAGVGALIWPRSPCNHGGR